MLTATGDALEGTVVDMSKFLGRQIKLLRVKQVVITVECMGVFQLLGARAQAAPMVGLYAYVQRSDTKMSQ